MPGRGGETSFPSTQGRGGVNSRKALGLSWRTWCTRRTQNAALRSLARSRVSSPAPRKPAEMRASSFNQCGPICGSQLLEWSTRGYLVVAGIGGRGDISFNVAEEGHGRLPPLVECMGQKRRAAKMTTLGHVGLALTVSMLLPSVYLEHVGPRK